MKINQASLTDQQILAKYETNKKGFSLLSKSRGDLAAMIPASANSQDVSQNPVVITIKKCLDDLNEISKQKDAIMAEGVAMHESLNAVEELMKVQQNAAKKQDVFDSFKNRYLQHFEQNVELERQRQNISQTIAQNG